MGKEIKDEKEILKLTEQIDHEWRKAVLSSNTKEQKKEIMDKIFSQVEELLKIDFDQSKKEQIAKKLVEESKKELMEIITKDNKFSQEEKMMREALERLHRAREDYKKGNFNDFHMNIQVEIGVPVANIKEAIKEEIDVNRSVEKVAERIRSILKHLEKEK